MDQQDKRQPNCCQTTIKPNSSRKPIVI